MSTIKQIPLQKRGLNASQLVLGSMGMGSWEKGSSITADHIKSAQEAVETALEIGITLFDHADIYTHGQAEQIFGQILKDKPGLRDSILIQSKCGIKLGTW